MKCEQPNTEGEKWGLVATIWVCRKGGRPGDIAPNYKYQFQLNMPGDWVCRETGQYCYYNEAKALANGMVTLPETGEGKIQISGPTSGVFFISELSLVEVLEAPVKFNLGDLEKR